MKNKEQTAHDILCELLVALEPFALQWEAADEAVEPYKECIKKKTGLLAYDSSIKLNLAQGKVSPAMWEHAMETYRKYVRKEDHEER